MSRRTLILNINEMNKRADLLQINSINIGDKKYTLFGVPVTFECEIVEPKLREE